jgi:hypothetical protein
MRRSAFLEYVNIDVIGKINITLEVWLLFMSNILNIYKLTKDFGTWLVMLFPFKMMVPNNVTFFSVGKMVPSKPNFP